MYKDKSFLAIVPARGGSKGLPRKNIKELCGKPLIAWTIDEAKKSKYVDEIVVTTDSDEIASVSKQYGAKVPFIRPAELANDVAKSIDVVEHTIEFYKKQYQKEFDYIVLLEPTSPMRDASDIDCAIEQLLVSDADSIVGVCRTEDQNPAFLVKISEDRRITGYKDEKMTSIRRQDIEDVYFFEGTVYISKTDVLLSKKSFYHNNTLAYEVPKYKSLEVDDIYDFIMIEALIKYREME